MFLFYEEFDYKPMAKKKKKKTVAKPSVAVAQGKAQETPAELPPEEEEEDEDSSSEEDLGECIILEEGTYKLSAAYRAK